MRTFLFFFIFVFGVTGNVFGQDVSKYKYVLVPQEFEFLKHQNQYELNALTAFLFEKYGFEVLYEEKFPSNVGICDVLKADVHSKSGLFRSKLYVTLETCDDKVVFTSQTGVSREKEFQRSYHEALREAFTSFEGLRKDSENIDSVAVTERASHESPPGEVVIDPVPAPEVTAESSNPPEVIIDPVPASHKVQKAPSEVIIDPVVTSEEMDGTVGEDSAGIPEAVNADDHLQFVNGARIYNLIRTAAGYELYREGETEKFGTLLKSGGGENFLYSSKNLSGNAFFDTHGNLVVEYLDPNSQQLVSVKYNLKDQ